MRRIGVMGGTFDPVHHGHLVAASEVAHDFTLDEVIFVPTGEPYQKDHRRVSPAEDRYLMTVIATARAAGPAVTAVSPWRTMPARIRRRPVRRHQPSRLGAREQNYPRADINLVYETAH